MGETVIPSGARGQLMSTFQGEGNLGQRSGDKTLLLGSQWEGKEVIQTWLRESEIERVWNQESLIVVDGGRIGKCHLQGCDTCRSFSNHVSKMNIISPVLFLPYACTVFMSTKLRRGFCEWMYCGIWQGAELHCGFLGWSSETGNIKTWAHRSDEAVRVWVSHKAELQFGDQDLEFQSLCICRGEILRTRKVFHPVSSPYATWPSNFCRLT